MNPLFNITSHDGIWSTNLSAKKEIILALIKDPAAFISSLPNLGDIVIAPGRVTILFEYGRAPGNEFIVHGVSRTSLITVRAPKLNVLGTAWDAEGGSGVHADFLAPSSTSIQAARRTDVDMAYVHYDPVVTDNEIAFDEMANLIVHPASLPLWLATKQFDPDPYLIDSQGGMTPDQIATSYAYSELGDNFTLVYQTHETTPPLCLDPCTLVQCIKSSGEYVLNESIVTMTIDEVLVVLWCDCPDEP